MASGALRHSKTSLCPGKFRSMHDSSIPQCLSGGCNNSLTAPCEGSSATFLSCRFAKVPANELLRESLRGSYGDGKENSFKETKRVKMSKVYIIILNTNGCRDTVECLESVFRLRYPDFTVVVCDNA